eukprot:CAMPEP_0205861282 /NCGR_PEP_ID=MMETSP1083-20121108/5687_1 /ASSEMBLY_ACC=CAM_ASM_000430 /TAXON_ID=97485 /ORGANISM="Prymnesium parvum, Strain Texoma1" /LENGTH=76 /DNA_ID=CAMNT_0053222977 /DNA_START=565 /DNA_END=795 /DNA_ORIENTATION=-
MSTFLAKPSRRSSGGFKNVTSILVGPNDQSSPDFTGSTAEDIANQSATSMRPMLADHNIKGVVNRDHLADKEFDIL